MRSVIIILCLMVCSIGAWAQETQSGMKNAPPKQARPADPKQQEERTSFQTGENWDPMLQLRADVAMCYGVGPDIGGRIAQWKAQGYRIHVMTGVAWGNYQDYLYGRFDGVNHVDEAQTDRNGQVIGHGGDVYYMCPGENYGKFLCLGVQRAIDAGAEAIHLEEPEFWVRAGYSAGFKREWKAHFHEDWIPPHTSPDAQYRASELKYYLYRRALAQIFDYVHAYNRRTGKHIRCYVPTHSLLNYAQWGIVSPESSLRAVGADGYIAQVWTGTARTPNVYAGRVKERTFETAFLEYGAMMNVVRAGGGRIWFLNDPVEDDPDHSWQDYRSNWESTLTASLLWPQVWRYEIMPWPERVFHGRYPTTEPGERKPGAPPTLEPIPPSYATELMTVTQALNDMQQSDVRWECGTQGVGIVVSDTLMFERGDPTPSDPHLSSFYGLAMPLVKRGIPVAPVQLETADRPGALTRYKALLMTYEGMKPMSSEAHAALAKWVRAGGVLVFVDADDDPYNSVRAWWNTPPLAYQTPRRHLFDLLGIPDGAGDGTVQKVDSGTVIYRKLSPAALAHSPTGGDEIRDLAERACQVARLPFTQTNYFVLRRGPYVVAAGLDESLTESPHILQGRFIDLFDANLPILTSVILTPGSRHLLLDLDRTSSEGPAILAAACKTLAVQRTSNGGLRFYAEGPDATQTVARIRMPSKPSSAQVDGKPLPPDSLVWDADTHTILLRFANSAAGHWIDLTP